MANDYLGDWKCPDARMLSEIEKLMASLCHVTRFNKRPDAIREIVRAHLVFGQAPETGALSNPELRATIEQKAFFGSDFEGYYRAFVLPLYFLSVSWGLRQADGAFAGPLVDSQSWLKATALPPGPPQSAFNALTIDRTTAQAKLRSSLREDGLPHSPALFIASPFVRMSDGSVVAASPWMVREHLRGGLWMRMKTAVEKELGDAEEWSRAFGQMFELTCRDLAKQAASAPSFAGKLLLSTSIGGSDELEDVVILEDDGIVLISAKSRLVRQSVAREADSRSKLIDWYEDFLFEERKGNRRAGALRLLDSKVRAIRNGDFESVPANAKICPILVTFDDLCETPALNRWVAQRSLEHDILQEGGVVSPLLTTLEGLESLLAMASNGLSMTSLLAAKANTNGRFVSLSHFLAEHNPDGTKMRLPALAQHFKQLTDETEKLLFPTKDAGPD